MQYSNVYIDIKSVTICLVISIIKPIGQDSFIPQPTKSLEMPNIQQVLWGVVMWKYVKGTISDIFGLPWSLVRKEGSITQT